MAKTIRELIEQHPDCLDREIHTCLDGGYYTQSDICVDTICENKLYFDDDCDGNCDTCDDERITVVVVLGD